MKLAKWAQFLIGALCVVTFAAFAYPKEVRAQAKKRFYSAGSFTTGTQPYFYMATLAGLLRQHTRDISLTNEATGGSNENLDLLRRGEIQLGVSSPERLYSAYHGIGKYAGKKTEVYILWQFNQQAVLMFTLADSPIRSIADLKGKKVVIGPAGSANEVKNSAVLEAYGFRRKPNTPSEFQDLTTVRLAFPEAAQALAERTVDAAIITEQVPSAYFSELALTRSVRVSSIEQSMFDKVRKVYPALWPTLVPKNSYKGQTEELTTLGDPNYLIASRNLPDDDAYLLTKIYVEELLPKLAANIAFVEPYVKNKALITSAFVIPTHPGALRYYKEKGMNVQQVEFK